mmetsp:Transcript_14449/g.43402  ORF Transcript_14449/g.43402 Transcript_14449/m.43402 type:complete len:292 (-) Transcript_14449:33-908(-)
MPTLCNSPSVLTCSSQGPCVREAPLSPTKLFLRFARGSRRQPMPLMCCSDISSSEVPVMRLRPFRKSSGGTLSWTPPDMRTGWFFSSASRFACSSSMTSRWSWGSAKPPAVPPVRIKMPSRSTGSSPSRSIPASSSLSLHASASAPGAPPSAPPPRSSVVRPVLSAGSRRCIGGSSRSSCPCAISGVPSVMLPRDTVAAGSPSRVASVFSSSSLLSISSTTLATIVPWSSPAMASPSAWCSAASPSKCAAAASASSRLSAIASSSRSLISSSHSIGGAQKKRVTAEGAGLK